MQTRFYANFVFQKYSIISFVCELKKKKKKSRINIYGVLILKLVGREKAPRQDECQLDFMRISFYVFHEYLIFSFVCEFKKKKRKPFICILISKPIGGETRLTGLLVPSRLTVV